MTVGKPTSILDNLMHLEQKYWNERRRATSACQKLPPINFSQRINNSDEELRKILMCVRINNNYRFDYNNL